MQDEKIQYLLFTMNEAVLKESLIEEQNGNSTSGRQKGGKDRLISHQNQW